MPSPISAWPACNRVGDTRGDTWRGVQEWVEEVVPKKKKKKKSKKKKKAAEEEAAAATPADDESSPAEPVAA